MNILSQKLISSLDILLYSSKQNIPANAEYIDSDESMPQRARVDIALNRWNRIMIDLAGREHRYNEEMLVVLFAHRRLPLMLDLESTSRVIWCEDGCVEDGLKVIRVVVLREAAEVCILIAVHDRRVDSEEEILGVI